MNKLEYKLQLRALAKLFWVCGFGFLYAIGGIEHKEIRRFVAPIWLCSGMYLFSKDWKVFLQAPLLMVSLSLGYGADAFWAKIYKRAIFGLANSLTAFVHKNWKILIMHIILSVFACVAFGVFNPFNSARAEELAIGFIIGWLPMYMRKDKEPQDGRVS